MKKLFNRIKNWLFDSIDSNGLQNVLTTMLLVAGGFILIVFILYFYRFSDWDFITNNNKQDWGTFGDFIGGTLNPLLSFLGFIALLYTIVLQSNELEETSNELKKSADAQHEIQKTQRKQQFESTFFALLDQHNRILERLLKEPQDSRDIPIPYDYHDEEGNLEEIRTTTKNYIEALIEKIASIRNKTRNKWFVEIYFQHDKFHSEGIKIFGKEIPEDKISSLCAANLIIKEREKCANYFLFLYQLLKFIATNIPADIPADANPFDEIKKGNQPPLLENEKMYSNIVRSLLTNDITFLLVIMCYCQNEDDDYWKYKLLIERYALFEHIKWKMDWYMFTEETKNHYDKSAFGNNPLPSNKK